MMVRTCHSKKSAPSTTAADRRAITIVRTTCAGAKRTHTTPSSEGVGVVVGFVGSVCEPLRSGVSPLFSLIPSPQLRTADRDCYTTSLHNKYPRAAKSHFWG